MKECEVCCEEYKVGVECIFCQYGTCTNCVQTYLLSTANDPHCMKCKNPWSREFIASKFSKKFITQDLKTHRENVLLDRERSMLPATQETAERERTKRALEKELEPYKKHLQSLSEEQSAKQYILTNYETKLKPILDRTREVLNIQGMPDKYVMSQLETSRETAKLVELRNELHNAKRIEAEYWSSVGDITVKKRLLKTQMMPIYRRIKMIETGSDVSAAGPSTSKTTYVRACPVNECRGYLSSGWKCGMCGVNVCAKCHEIKERNAEGKLREHECKPENVETAKLLAKEARPCPSCSTMICKVSGCDQMWCTQCHTAFSWQTGAIVKGGIIHNPHYFEYLRQKGQQPPQAGREGCGNTMPNFYIITGYSNTPHYSLLTSIYQCIGEAFDLRNKYAENRLNDNENIRVRFLLGDFDEARFKQLLQMRAKANDKLHAIHQILETFVTVGIGCIHELVTKAEHRLDTAERFIQQLEGLRTYITESFEGVAKIYNCKVPIITSNWNIIPVGQRKEK